MGPICNQLLGMSAPWPDQLLSWFAHQSQEKCCHFAIRPKCLFKIWINYWNLFTNTKIFTGFPPFLNLKAIFCWLIVPSAGDTLWQKPNQGLYFHPQIWCYYQTTAGMGSLFVPQIVWETSKFGAIRSRSRQWNIIPFINYPPISSPLPILDDEGTKTSTLSV